MTEKQYFPAMFVADFKGAGLALERVGFTTEEAALCLSHVDVGPDQPAVLEVVINDPERELSPATAAIATIVLTERPSGLIGLWLGMPQHMNTSREIALLDAVDEFISDGEDVPDTLEVLEWAPPKMRLQ